MNDGKSMTVSGETVGHGACRARRRVRLRRLGATILAAMLGAGAIGCGGEEGIATVGGDPITAAEFDAYLALRNVPRDNARQREAALQQYVEREALARVIEQEGLLDPMATSVEINEFRKEMLISRYFDAYLRDQVTDQAVLNYYNANPDSYSEQRAHVGHILIRLRPDMDESERQVRLTTAQEVYTRLRSGADFGELARDYSEDKVSGKKGGDLGWLKPGAISAVFSQRVFELEPGVVSEPFETPFGFHVAKVFEGPQEVKQSFDAVKGQIRHQLRNQAREAELARLLDGAQYEITGADQNGVAAGSDGE